MSAKLIILDVLLDCRAWLSSPEDMTLPFLVEKTLDFLEGNMTLVRRGAWLSRLLNGAVWFIL